MYNKPCSVVDFRAKALDAFPELREDFEEDYDLPHVQMGAFARLAQRAKGEGDWDAYAKCVRIADELWGCADPELKNALYVSFLEHLDFEGPHGGTAWGHLTPRLQAGWKELEVHWQSIFRGKPNG